MTDLLLKNGRIIDPVNSRDEVGDILVRKGRIAGVGADLTPGKSCQTIDVSGKWCVPGLVDMHVHLREPGREDKETIESGCRAAVVGGFTSIACMPNTNPVNDCQAVTRFILEKAASAPARVYPVAAITQGLEGRRLTDMAELIDSGAVAFSDDGRCVTNTDHLRRALDYVRMFDGLIIEHCEDPVLSEGGAMREGYVCTTLGLPPIPSLAEEIMVARDIRVAEYTGGRLHIAHVSSRESVRLLQEARQRGIRVTAEVTPHHLFLTDDAVRSFDTHTKMNPPLGSQADRDALEDALISGVIDCIASDHAPHTVQEKMVEYTDAPNGVIGLETTLPLVITRLVHTRKMTPVRMVEVLSVSPARILGIDAGTLSEEARADITVIDPERLWIVDPARFQSKSRNTPFGGLSLRGSCVMTIMDGSIVFQIEES